MELRRARIALIRFTARHHRLAGGLWLGALAAASLLALAALLGPRMARQFLTAEELHALATWGPIVQYVALALWALWLLLLSALPGFSVWYSRRFRYLALAVAQAAARARAWRLRATLLALAAVAAYLARDFLLHPGKLVGRDIPWSTIGGAVGLATLLAFAVNASWRARRSILIQPFEDHSGDATLAAAVAGLAARLSMELAAILNVYRVIDEAWNNPLDSAELLPRVDLDVTQLAGAIAADAKLNLGVLQVPLGWLLDLPGRLVRGPRLNASLHREGDCWLLIAELSGGSRKGTWAVSSADLDTATPSDGVNAAAPPPHLAAMVEQLAYRLVTDLAPVGSPRWRAVRDYTRGLSAYRETQRTQRDRTIHLRDAEELFLRARNEDNLFTRCHYNLAAVYTQLGQPQAATDALRGAYREGQATADVAQALGLVYQQSQRHSEAIQAFDIALRRDPGRAASWRLKAFNVRKEREKLLGTVPPENDEVWREVIGLRQAASALAWRALCHSRLRGDSDLRPGQEAQRCLADLGVAMAQTGNFRASARLIRQALDALPNSGTLNLDAADTLKRSRLEMSKVLRASESWEAALEVLGEVDVDERDIGTAAALYSGRLQCHEALHRKTAEVSHARAAHLAFCRLLDCLAVDAGATMTAFTQASGPITLEYAARLQAAAGLVVPERLGDQRQRQVFDLRAAAVATLERRNAESVDDYLSRLAAARPEAALSDDDKAAVAPLLVSWASWSKEVRKTSPPASLATKIAYLDEDWRWAAARPLVRLALAAGPDDPAPAEAAVEALAKLEGKGLLEAQAEQLEVRIASAHFSRAVLTHRDLQPQLIEALAHAEQAVDTAPSDPLSHHTLGNIYKAVNDVRRADAEWRRGLALDPNNFSAVSNVARGYWNQGVLACSVAGRRSAFLRVVELLEEARRLVESRRLRGTYAAVEMDRAGSTIGWGVFTVICAISSRPPATCGSPSVSASNRSNRGSLWPTS